MLTAIFLFFTALFIIIVTVLAKSDLFAQRAVTERGAGNLLGFGWLRAEKEVKKFAALTIGVTALVVYAVAEIIFDGVLLFPASIAPVIVLGNLTFNWLLARRDGNVQTVSLPKYPPSHMSGCRCAKCEVIRLQIRDIMIHKPRIMNDAWWKEQLFQSAESYLAKAQSGEIQPAPATDLKKKWMLACLRNGLHSIGDDGIDKPLPIVASDAKSMTVDPLGFTRAEIENLLPRLSASLGGVKLHEANETKDGLLKIMFAANSLPTHISLADVPELLGLVFGLSSSGWKAMRPEDWPHMMVSGTSGSGKSVFLRFLLLQILVCYSDAQIIVATPKPKDFRLFRHNRIRQVTLRSDFDAILAELEAERDRREMSASDDHSPVFIIIDEVVAILNADNIEIMERLVTMSRSANYHCIMATQRPTLAEKKMSGAIRENLDQRICFRVKSITDSDKAVGSKLAYHLKKIPGRAIYDNCGTSVEIQVPLIEKASNEITQVCQSTT